MKVTYGLGRDNKERNNTVLAIGVFDGVHRGHQALIRAAVKQAKALKGQVAVLTFFPHPVHVLNPKAARPLIQSLEHRIRLIQTLGVDHCIVACFTKRFSQISPERFVKNYLVDRIGPQEIVVGRDFRFGRGREGGLDYFRALGERYGVKVKTVNPATRGRTKIGSTMIRHLITEGKLKQAQTLLGRPVSLMGKVTRGDGRGKSLGFPTANIYPCDVLTPTSGVYAVKVLVGQKTLAGMANIGQRPSFKTAAKENIEIHIFDFKKNLYDQEIIVEFIQKIRNEKKFSTQEKLIQQLKKDEQNVRYLNNNGEKIEKRCYSP